MAWIHALEYKANLYVGLFAIFSGLLIEYLIWKQIFIVQDVEYIRGFSFRGLMAFIFLSMIVGQLKSSWVTSIEMIDEIRTGELNKYLIRPISFFSYNLMMFIGMNSIYYLGYSVLLCFFPFFFPGLILVSILNIIGFILALIVSIYLSYSIYFIMVCFTFWLHEVRALVIAFNISNLILSGQIIPLKMFPASIVSIIHFTPLPFLVDFPVGIATNQYSIDVWAEKFLFAICWCLLMTIIGKIIYRLGIKQYGAYGA